MGRKIDAGIGMWGIGGSSVIAEERLGADGVIQHRAIRDKRM